MAGTVIPGGSNGLELFTSTNPGYVALKEAVGSLSWAFTAFALNGSSQTLLAANANRKGLLVSNPVGNGTISVDITGGTAALATRGINVPAGQGLSMTGADCPTGAVTVIGTNTQTVTVYEGT